MPTYKITDPDSGKVVRVTGDAPPSEDEIHQFFNPSSDPNSDYIFDKAATGKHLAAQRVLEASNSLGLGTVRDVVAPLIGGVDALIRGKNSKYGKDTFGGGWDATRDAARRDLSQYEHASPLESLGVAAAGMMPSIIAAAPETAGKALGARILQSAKAGSTLGGVEGFANAQGGFQNRAQSGVLGALAGGTLGTIIPAIPAGVKGVARIVSKVKQSPEEFAFRGLSDALAADNVTLPKAKATLTQPGKAIIDVGGEGTTALGEQGALSGKGRVIAKQFFDANDKAREGKLVDAVKQTFSDSGYYDKLDEANAQRVGDAKPLYADAYSAAYRRTPRLTNLADRPAIGGAARTAMTRLLNDPDMDQAEVKAAMEPIFGPNVDDLSDAQLQQRLTQAMGTRPIEFKVLDYIKRGLDAMSNSPDATPEIRRLRGAWRDELKTINPKYQVALNAWAGPSAVLDAAEAGRKFDKVDPEAIQRLLGSYGESEQEAYRIGVSRRLQDLSGTSKNAAMGMADHINGSTNLQKRLQAVVASQGQDAPKLLSRNGWQPAADGTYRNISQPNMTIEVQPDGKWSLQQTSNTGRSSSLKNSGPDQLSLESFLTGKPVSGKPSTSVDDLIQTANELVDRDTKKKAIIGNSATARRLEGSDDLADQVGKAVGSTKGGLVGMAAHAFGISRDYVLRQLTGARREAISKLLYSTDPADNQRAIEAIEKIQQGKSVDQLLYTPKLAPGLVGSVSGAQIGKDN